MWMPRRVRYSSGAREQRGAWRPLPIHPCLQHPAAVSAPAGAGAWRPLRLTLQLVAADAAITSSHACTRYKFCRDSQRMARNSRRGRLGAEAASARRFFQPKGPEDQRLGAPRPTLNVAPGYGSAVRLRNRRCSDACCALCYRFRTARHDLTLVCCRHLFLILEYSFFSQI